MHTYTFFLLRGTNILNNYLVLSKREIISGVLQGSMLGLFLITLYINILVNRVNGDVVCSWYKPILKSMPKAMTKRPAKTHNNVELLGGNQTTKTTTNDNSNKETTNKQMKLKLDKCK